MDALLEAWAVDQERFALAERLQRIGIAAARFFTWLRGMSSSFLRLAIPVPKARHGEARRSRHLESIRLHGI